MGRRLGIELNKESPCPFCFQIMDVWGAHSESCMASGDTVLLTNEGRDTVHRQAAAGGARPELESGGLFAALGEPGVAGRRPADTLLCSAMGMKTAKHRRLPKVAVDMVLGLNQYSAAGKASIRAASLATGIAKSTLADAVKRAKENLDNVAVGESASPENPLGVGRIHVAASKSRGLLPHVAPKEPLATVKANSQVAEATAETDAAN